MLEGVQLWDIEVGTYPEVSEAVFVVVESCKCVVKKAQSSCRLRRILRNVEEIEKSPNCRDNTCRGSVVG